MITVFVWRDKYNTIPPHDSWPNFSRVYFGVETVELLWRVVHLAKPSSSVGYCSVATQATPIVSIPVRVS